jgi:hypothetical protein
MSNHLFGNANTLSQIIRPLGHKFAVASTCSVAVKSFINRKTQAKTIRRYASKLGGFDERIWNPPTVAEVEETGEEYLFDGDHSRHMFRIAYPNEKMMPCVRIYVKNKEELSRLFVHINKYGLTNLTAEELFVHEYHAGSKEASDTEKHLASSNLKVSLGTGEANSSVGSNKGKEVKIAGFRVALKKSSGDAVRASSKILQKAWHKYPDVKTELLAGVAIAINDPRILSDKILMQNTEDFVEFTSKGKTPTKALTAWKIAGGKIGNEDHNCVAMGFLEEYRDYCKINGIQSTKTFRKYYGSRMDAIKKALDRAKNS